MWKHPNARVAYVAQHAFHHIESHLEKTPNEYIRWRYSGGDDKEAIVKDDMKLWDEEKALLEKPVEWQEKDSNDKIIKMKRVIKELTGERKEDKKIKATVYCARWKGLSEETEAARAKVAADSAAAKKAEQDRLAAENAEMKANIAAQTGRDEKGLTDEQNAERARLAAEADAARAAKMAEDHERGKELAELRKL